MKKKFLFVAFAVLSMCLCCCSKTESVAGPQGEPGQNGQDGADGQDGKDGADGTSLLTGHGVPSSNLGKLGDSYIDLDTWDYYTKTSNGWVKQGNIKGSSGEDGKDGVDGITYIPAIFNNYDGTMLYTFYYEKGSTIAYNGPTPTRPSDWNGDEELPYTFKGWDKSLENIQEPTIFTAQYRSKMYDVIFKNYDGSTLFATQVERGHDAIYDGAIPVRDDNPNLEWTFTGWDKPLANILKDTVFIAQFYAPNSFQCIFKNYDGTVLSTQYVGNGDNVVYEGTAPTKPDDNEEGIITKYEFIGWDKSLKNISADTEFTAQYDSVTYYEVKFVNYDNTVLYTTSTFGGGQVIYGGDTPTKPDSVDGTTITRYRFKGWDKSLSNISSPTTLTATFSSYSFTGYQVSFLDSDGSELYSNYFEKGSDAVYPYEIPFTYDAYNVTLFVGWSSSIKNITETLTVTIQYKTIDRKQNGEYPQSVVTDEALIMALNSITETNSNGYYEYGGEQYEKLIATPYTSYIRFDNNEIINNGECYYFKVEPIQWEYLDNENGEASLVSSKLLDSHKYVKPDYDSAQGYFLNNYKRSGVRSWLNDDFLNKAFQDSSLLATTTVDNSVASTGDSSNKFVCETTYDKVFLLSRPELQTGVIGSSSSPSTEKYCETTEYVRAKGAQVSGTNGCYWTRTPCSSYAQLVWCVSSGQTLNGNYKQFDILNDDDGSVCVRPAITLMVS